MVTAINVTWCRQSTSGRMYVLRVAMASIGVTLPSYSMTSFDYVLYRPHSRTLHVDFRTDSSSGLIFLVGNMDTADMASAYISRGHLTFARRCGHGRAFEIHRERVDDRLWHSVSACALHRACGEWWEWLVMVRESWKVETVSIFSSCIDI